MNIYGFKNWVLEFYKAVSAGEEGRELQVIRISFLTV